MRRLREVTKGLHRPFDDFETGPEFVVFCAWWSDTLERFNRFAEVLAEPATWKRTHRASAMGLTSGHTDKSEARSQKKAPVLGPGPRADLVGRSRILGTGFIRGVRIRVPQR